MIRADGRDAQDSHGVIQTIADLKSALRIAAEIEHLLCCEYLFACMSLRRTLEDFDDILGLSDDTKRRIMARTQEWAGQLTRIARQEMEHLAIVCNLLSAAAEPAHLWRPNFPILRPKPEAPTPYPIPADFCLQRVNRNSLDHFLFFERPAYLTEPKAPERCCEGLSPASTTAAATPVFITRTNDTPRLASHGAMALTFHSVQQLYAELRAAYLALPPEECFAGSAAGQVDSGTVQWASNVRVPPITNRDDAVAAITQITAEGEGLDIVPTAPESHFSRFVAILEDFERVSREFGIDPALPVVPNPSRDSPPPPSTSPITCSYTMDAMKLFDQVYLLMLCLVQGFWSTYAGKFGTYPAFASEPANAAMFHAAFYPLMTNVIRPLGDMVCRLPASGSDPSSKEGPRAGPAFALPPFKTPSIPQLTRAEALARFAEIRKGFDGLEVNAPKRFRVSVRTLGQAVHRLAADVARLWPER